MDFSALEKQGYKLVWQDDFSAKELDRDSWNVEEHPDHWDNDELQSIVDDGQHVFIRDGHLVIKPERIIEQDKTVSYKSARINTKGKRDFIYGYFEVRAKVSRGKGFLSAVRLLSPTDPYGSWPKSGSIDILVADGQYPQKGNGIVHFGEPSEVRSGTFGDGTTDLSEDFHTYAVEWIPGKITFFMDGEEYFSENRWFSSKGEGHPRLYPAPFDRQFSLELDVAIGGYGTAAPGRLTSFDENSELQIDYIKVYRKEEYDEDVELPQDIKEFKEADDNGNFITNGYKDWRFEVACAGEGAFEQEDDTFTIDTVAPGDADYSLQLYQAGLPACKGKKYRVSFEAQAAKKRNMMVAVTAPDVHWVRYLEDTNIEVSESWQEHILPFEMTFDDDDNARLEFNLGNTDSTSTIRIRNVKYEEISYHTDGRRTLAICGAWEDAENYNLFIQSFMTPRVRENYVVMSFTFGLTEEGITKVDAGLELVELIDRFNLAAMFVFAEMIKTEEVLKALREVAQRKRIPIVFLERQSDGVINAMLNYASGFEKMVGHILDHHGCKKVKFFGGFKDNPFSIERENIFKRLMHAHKLQIGEDDILYGDFWDATTVRVLNEKLDEGMELPEAFVCANDSMALGVCDCLRKRGVRVPEDVLVTGFDGTIHGSLRSPALTTAVPDYSSICNYVLDIIESKQIWRSGQTIRRHIDYTEVDNESCGCRINDHIGNAQVINTLSDNNQDYFRHTLEMGKFVTHTLSLNDIDQASLYLNNYLWLWKTQYYFVGLTKGYDKGCVHALVRGVGEDLYFKTKYYNLRYPVPKWDSYLLRGSGLNVFLFRQIRTYDDEYGYMCCGYDDLDMRKQQRFEEFGLYVSSMVSSVLDKTKIMEASRAISSLNERDYLTNLYNRRGFFEHVNDMLHSPKNRGRIFSLFSIDMDGLKYINDHFGHQEGDNAIIILSKALSAFAGDRGVCARYGGDEFAMAIVGDFNIADDYNQIRATIHEHAMRDTFVRELDYNINASMGISECVITDDIDIEALIREADMRMYEDKQARKGSNEIR